MGRAEEGEAVEAGAGVGERFGGLVDGAGEEPLEFTLLTEMKRSGERMSDRGGKTDHTQRTACSFRLNSSISANNSASRSGG